MQSINLSIVTTSNFGPLLAEISSLEAKLKSLNTLTAKTGSGFTSAQAVKELKNLGHWSIVICHWKEKD